MAAVKELLRVEEDGTLSLGDSTLAQNKKSDNFEFDGDVYKAKTFAELKKLERNGMFVYESVPGTAVEHFAETEDEVAFTVSAKEDAQFTLELEPDCEYIVYVDDVNIGKMMTNLSGKLSVSAELQEGVNAKIRVARV